MILRCKAPHVAGASHLIHVAADLFPNLNPNRDLVGKILAELHEEPSEAASNVCKVNRPLHLSAILFAVRWIDHAPVNGLRCPREGGSQPRKEGRVPWGRVEGPGQNAQQSGGSEEARGETGASTVAHHRAQHTHGPQGTRSGDPREDSRVPSSETCASSGRPRPPPPPLRKWGHVGAKISPLPMKSRYSALAMHADAHSPTKCRPELAVKPLIVPKNTESQSPRDSIRPIPSGGGD